ncbi:unnamed protein product [Oikopleura dioica]|uniref:Uncharacterized protein n=1 Tax=Oikopleura dioica TaxID=34765 RepID=E4XZN7_OIKDI|nr:unnamed protein product [Oikopleura dioica]
MSLSKMTRPNDGQWAWTRYRNDPRLWEILYHENPLHHLVDPRGPRQSVTEPNNPAIGEVPGSLIDPTSTRQDNASVLQRVAHDSELYNLVFGRITQRPASPDSDFLDPDGISTLDLRYRTAPMNDFKPHVEADPNDKLHFDVLNETQLQLYLTADDKTERTQNWYRAGYCYSEFHNAELRKMSGDLTASDHQGLEYNLRLRVLENQQGPPGELFTPEEIQICEYIIESLMSSMDPRSRHFRCDLLKLNSKNNFSLQSFGMQALTGTRVYRDSQGALRNESPNEIALRLSRFGNLVPLQAHRDIFRKVMGKDQSLTVNDYLLNPIDAARLGTFLLIMPKYERDLVILQGIYGGSTKRTHKSSEFCISSSGIPTPVSTDDAVRAAQHSLTRLSDHARRNPSSTAVVYKSAHQGLPLLAENPDIAPALSTDTDSTTSASVESVDITDADSLASDPSTVTDYSAYDELDEACPRIRTENLPLRQYSSWVYLLQRSRSETHASMDCSSLNASTPPQHASVASYEIPVLEGCAIDPRESDSYVYDPTQEPSDNSFLHVGPAEHDPEISPPFQPDHPTGPLTHAQRRLVISEFGRLNKFGDPGVLSDTDSESLPDFEALFPGQRTAQQHLKDLLFSFQDRIIRKGNRHEIFFLAMSEPKPGFLAHASCLHGLTSTQKRAVIGPFTPEEREKFNQRFNPGQLQISKRLAVFDALYQLDVPDNSEDFKEFVCQDPLPPAIAYINAREEREQRPIYQEPLPTAAASDPTEADCAFPSTTVPSSESANSTSETFTQLPGAVQMPDPSTWPHQRHKEFLDQISGLPEPSEPHDFDGYLADVQSLLTYDPLRLSPTDFDPPADVVREQFTTPILKWFSGQQLKTDSAPVLDVNLDLRSQLEGSEVPRIEYYDQPGYLEFPHDLPAEDVTEEGHAAAQLAKQRLRSFLRRQQQIFESLPNYTTAADYATNVTYFTTIPQAPSHRYCLFTFPSTAVPVLTEHHSREARYLAKSGGNFGVQSNLRQAWFNSFSKFGNHRI